MRFALLILALAVSAQAAPRARPRPAAPLPPATAPVDVSTPPSGPTAASLSDVTVSDEPDTGRVTIAPMEEPGTVLVPLQGGYMRFEADAEDDGERGSVTIVAALPERAPDTIRIDPAAPATARVVAPAVAESESTPEACIPQRQQLAQRLMYVRGVDVDGPTAEILLVADQPFWPHVQLSLFGMFQPQQASSFVTQAAATDSEVRSRAHDLAACLQVHRRKGH